ncbi:hypothetical protein CUZ56_00478 [Saezia sanguinis]|uniref:Uncharacterized protein n=1 Tax=Saezia sanguinis TaxID=1965230 RepID=A0A433SGY4_9BURK|nr:major capsid protein [Saezia sanguinis]RUS67982.1 hypothetical protein CUZ56_00465 [Saezia sanguinis]RUS67995.1 hypothetical protein CUZ56_00478 [Saezia sanguinis]
MNKVFGYIKKGKRAVVAGVVAASAVVANAAPIDPAPVVSSIGSNEPAVIAIGGAIIAILAVVLGFKLIKRMM